LLSLYDGERPRGEEGKKGEKLFMPHFFEENYMTKIAPAVGRKKKGKGKSEGLGPCNQQENKTPYGKGPRKKKSFTIPANLPRKKKIGVGYRPTAAAREGKEKGDAKGPFWPFPRA